MKLSICLLAYGKVNFTLSCLQDLCKLPEDHEILVLNNNSPDNTHEKLKDYPRIKYYNSDVNLGFAGGQNFLYSKSSSPNVMFLNNDIRVKSNFESWTQPIIDKCHEGLVGPTMGVLDSQFNFIKESNSYLDSFYSYMSGWCLSSSKEIWNKLIINNYLGPFSEEFGKAYFEDADLSFRAKQIGISTNVVDVPVTHFGKISSRQINVSSLYNEARLVFINKWNQLHPSDK
jgi:GT2 family glycosyltransferase